MKKLVALLVAILMITTITACSDNSSNKRSKTYESFTLSTEVPVVYDDGSFMVNIKNPKEIVGWGDYVFVAKVEDELRTKYTNLRKSEEYKNYKKYVKDEVKFERERFKSVEEE